MKKKHYLHRWLNSGTTDTDAINQALWDSIEPLIPWGYSPIPFTNGNSGVYEDVGFTTQGTNGSEIAGGYKVFGHSIPPMSANTADLTLATFWSPSTFGNTWYQSLGEYPIYHDKGGFDRFLEIHNGTRITYETGAPAGSLSPSIGSPYHEILVWRTYPCAANETNNFWKQQGGTRMRFTPANPDVDSVSNTIFTQNETWEYKIYSAYATITLNAVMAGDTVTINGLLYTAVSGVKSDNTEFSIDTDDLSTALDLTDSIKGDVRVGTLNDVDAICNGSIVTVQQTVSGAAGNATTLVSSNGTRLPLSGSTFSNDGDWEIWKNGVVDSSGSGGAMVAYNEFKVGAVGHPMEFHHRASLINPDNNWTDAELTIIRGIINTCFPNGQNPSFPHFTAIEELSSRQFDSGIWDIRRDESEGDNIKVVGFGGGSGTEGSTTYQWYIWDQAVDGIAPSPQNNKFDWHTAIPGADGQGSTLTRAHYEAGNGRGNPTLFLNPGVVGNAWVMCVITPYDSLGVAGLPIVSLWVVDNTA